MTTMNPIEHILAVVGREASPLSTAATTQMLTVCKCCKKQNDNGYQYCTACHKIHARKKLDKMKAAIKRKAAPKAPRPLHPLLALLPKAQQTKETSDFLYVLGKKR